MSFDVFVQRFVDGQPAQADSAALHALVAPHVLRTEPEFNFAELGFEDGTADLYGIGDLATGFMVNHVSGELAWDLFAQVLEVGSMTLLPMGVPAIVCSEAVRAHLPDDFIAGAVIVSSGAPLPRRERVTEFRPR
ncbi:hypothetical protein [Actinotalea sp. JY-7876]|uniref:hypothetical protein n=1 Tax=Actinotalea sp. JY-7876 TaxID=2758442 RepID=UPI0015F6A325|nr:hypothetical protein [Actinotalea sp. JY-7876]